jgi:predicted nucleic acid-binding protein
MNKSLVINASPMILLGKADLLKAISPLAKTWIIPDGVIHEVQAKRSIELYLTDLASNSEIARETVSNIHPSIGAWDLGWGESQVLTLALEKPRTGVVLDDLQARKCAELFDIPLIGTLGLVILAKRKGLVPLVKPFIERLVAVGLYIDSAILARILIGVGEADEKKGKIF